MPQEKLRHVRPLDELLLFFLSYYIIHVFESNRAPTTTTTQSQTRYKSHLSLICHFEVKGPEQEAFSTRNNSHTYTDNDAVWLDIRAHSDKSVPPLSEVTLGARILLLVAEVCFPILTSGSGSGFPTPANVALLLWGFFLSSG